MRAQENSSDDKDDTSLDIKIHMRPQGNKALCFSSAKHNDIWVEQFITVTCHTRELMLKKQLKWP